MTDKLNRNQQPDLSQHDAELLSAYIDNILPPDEQDILEERLQDNLFLRRELAAMRQTVAWLNALPTLKAPRNFIITAEDVAPIPAKVIPMPKQNWWFAASSAAILIVIIGVAVILPSLSNQSPASDTASEQVALFSTSPAIGSENETTGYDDTAENNDGTTSESDFADQSAVGGMSAEAPPAPEIPLTADGEVQSQASGDINSRSMTVQPALADTTGQGSGADDVTEPQEAEVMSVVTSDRDDTVESDDAPNANIAASSVMEESANDGAVEEAEAYDGQDLGMLDTLESPEELTIDVIRSILEALRRFLEALQA